MIKVLFTGGGGAGNEAIYRLLNQRYDMHFADADLQSINPIVPGSRRHPIPIANDSRYVHSLAALCRELAIDLLVPGVDEELPHMPAVQKMLPGLRILVPEQQYVAIMMDKLSTARTLAEVGIEGPWTVPVTELEDVDYPCIFKPRHGRGSRGVQVVRSIEQARAYLVLSTIARDSIVAQQCLEGQEYTVMMAADSKAILHAVVPVKVQVKRGITIRASTCSNAAVIKSCMAIHNALPTCGCYNIQLMLTTDARALPFEINPRISTTFCLGVASGIDPLAIFLEEKEPDTTKPGFKNGVQLSRYWNNHLFQ